jgi:hypothetical protein
VRFAGGIAHRPLRPADRRGSVRSTRPRRGQGTDPAPLDVDTPFLAFDTTTGPLAMMRTGRAAVSRIRARPGTTPTSGGRRRVRFVAGGCVPGPSPWPASGRSWTTLVWRCSIRGSRSSTSTATGSPAGGRRVRGSRGSPGFYNTRRRHNARDRMSPVDYELRNTPEAVRRGLGLERHWQRSRCLDGHRLRRRFHRRW